MGEEKELKEKKNEKNGEGFFRKGEGIFEVREDIGRKNEIEKMIGEVEREGLIEEEGIVEIKSRV